LKNNKNIKSISLKLFFIQRLIVFYPCNIGHFRFSLEIFIYFLFRPCNLKFIWFWTFMTNFNSWNIWKFWFTFEEISVYPFVNLIKFRFTPCHIIDFVQSKFMKVQNQKTSNYKDEIQKENFTGEKPKMTYITWRKTLLTLYSIYNFTVWVRRVDGLVGWIWLPVRSISLIIKLEHWLLNFLNKYTIFVVWLSLDNIYFC